MKSCFVKENKKAFLLHAVISRGDSSVGSSLLFYPTFVTVIVITGKKASFILYKQGRVLMQQQVFIK